MFSRQRYQLEQKAQTHKRAKILMTPQYARTLLNSAVTSKALLPLFLPHLLLPGLTPAADLSDQIGSLPYQIGGPRPGCKGTPFVCPLRALRGASPRRLRARGRLGGAPASAVPASRGRCGADEDLSSAAWSDGDPEPQPASRDSSPAETHEFPGGNGPPRFNRKGLADRGESGRKILSSFQDPHSQDTRL